MISVAIRRLVVLPCLLVFGACAHSSGDVRPEVVAGSHEVVLSFPELSCQSCGRAMERMLSQRDGVHSAAFDMKKVEVVVRYDPSRTTPDSFVRSISEAGYQAVVGGGQGSYAPEVKFPDGLDVRWIAPGGEDVEIDAHRVADKVTVFDFYATWCGPCREVDQEMVEVMRQNGDVALRKINVVDWESPAAKRYLRNVRSLPYVLVYDRTGRRVAEVSGLDLEALRQAIQDARGR